jgi:hypothetical protein
MRFPAQRSWQGVLLAYNTLSANTDSYERLGRWVVSPDTHRVGTENHPEAIIFLPPKNAVEGSAVKVKAFSLEKPKLRPEDLEDLKTIQELIEQQAAELSLKHSEDAQDFEGEIRFHKGTGLLIASGGHQFVEIASTIIEAFKETLSRRGPHTVAE